jgi:tryptophan synthase alpha chain
VVVGSSLVQRVAVNLDREGRAKPGLVDAVLTDVRALAAAVRGGRVS